MRYSLARDSDHGTVRLMRELLILAIHLFVTFARLLGPGGVRAVAAESLILKHQLLISTRSRQRAPNLTSIDRFVLALTTLFVSPRRIAKQPVQRLEMIGERGPRVLQPGKDAAVALVENPLL